ncbi:MAG: enoyl-CoA hydratase-related protein [Acidimicrobiia bacterium]
MITTETRGDVHILKMSNGENRFNPASVATIDSALDEVEASEGPAAIVLTGEGKFFSNGLDLDWLDPAKPDGLFELAGAFQRLAARVLVSPIPIIAAMNGHAFAAGGMLALACDARMMRADRGYFCLPEVDINIPFTEGMSALIQAKLMPNVAHEVMTTGRRYSGPEAVASGIVHTCFNEEQLMPMAIAAAQALAGKNRETLGAIKMGMYGPVVKQLRG